MNVLNLKEDESGNIKGISFLKEARRQLCAYRKVRA
jgi:hypothetical protein